MADYDDDNIPTQDRTFDKPQSPLHPESVYIQANKDWNFLFEPKVDYNEQELFNKLNNYANRLPEMELLKMRQKYKMEE